jgi:hypothetical protein
VTSPNACPESLELQLLREIRDEMREEREETRRQLRALRCAVDVVVAVQRELATAQGFDLIIPAAKPTPLPDDPRASWAHPDMGGR